MDRQPPSKPNVKSSQTHLLKLVLRFRPFYLYIHEAEFLAFAQAFC